MFGVVAQPTMADDDDSKKAQTVEIAKAVNKLKPIAKKVSPKAEYLMVCDISSEDEKSLDMLKDLRKTARHLKSKKVTVLLISHDDSKKKTVAFLKKNKLKYATLMKEDMDEDVESVLSGYTGEHTVGLTLLNAEGTSVLSGGAELAENWADQMEISAKLVEMANEPVDAKKAPVAAALKAIPAAGGMLNTEADVYIYLFSASWCGPCRAEMPKIVKEREKMLQEGMKTEVVLIGADSSLEGVKKYMQDFNIPFYGVFARDPKVGHLPALEQPRGIPFCIFVDKKGNKIHSGHASAIMNWRTIAK